MDLRVLPSEKVQLYLLFYKPCSDDPFLNRLVAFFDSPFCHVEMAIPKRIGDEPWDRIMMASSIYQNQTVFFKEKTYDRQGYISFAIEITVAQLYKIKSFCKQHTDRMTPFSLSAMYAAYLPFQLVETDATFCSKHVTQALQFGGVGLVDNINPSLTTPSNLYKRLISANGGASAILQVIPSRMKAPFKTRFPCVGNETNAEDVLSYNDKNADEVSFFKRKKAAKQNNSNNNNNNIHKQQQNRFEITYGELDVLHAQKLKHNRDKHHAAHVYNPKFSENNNGNQDDTYYYFDSNNHNDDAAADDGCRMNNNNNISYNHNPATASVAATTTTTILMGPDHHNNHQRHLHNNGAQNGKMHVNAAAAAAAASAALRQTLTIDYLEPGDDTMIFRIANAAMPDDVKGQTHNNNNTDFFWKNKKIVQQAQNADALMHQQRFFSVAPSQTAPLSRASGFI
jgi:hypothetical protein